MKDLFLTALRFRSNFALLVTKNNSLSFFCAAALISFVMLGCTKENSLANDEVQNITNASLVAESNAFGRNSNLALETIWELQQAKIATARYNNINNAIADNYVDINVIVPEMGHHYMKMANLDGTFEYNKPEILVYNREENGRMKLVAVEYAVPIEVSANAPAGFTGSHDQWSVYQGTLWTLHAWVWENNPLGVFNSTNPNVHVHD